MEPFKIIECQVDEDGAGFWTRDGFFIHVSGEEGKTVAECREQAERIMGEIAG
jgi:hypothetical protein